MFNLILTGSLIALIPGGVLWLILHVQKSPYKMNYIELAICSAFLLIVAVPSVTVIGTKLAFQNKVSYHEFYGGYETKAFVTETTCHEDGSCVHCYQCDPYTVYYDCSYTSGSGKNAHTVHQTCSRIEHHSCPYATAEYSFYIDTTLGTYAAAENIFEEHPQEWRWGSGIPSDVERGIPELWQAANQRLIANNPGPVTQQRNYANYVLASHTTILHKFSASIDRYKAQKLLPDFTPKIHDLYQLDRVYPLGIMLQDPQAWQTAINRFDAALGADLQGDLYVVIVDAKQISDPDDYSMAVDAYAQSPQLGKDAISKNGIIVVIGTKDGETVSWARAKTGMPVGNEEMLYDIQNQLPHSALTPESLLGAPTATVTQVKNKYLIQVHHTAGAWGKLEAILWGPHKFSRVCMTCTSPGSHGVGYSYLKNEIEPSAADIVYIYIVVGILSIFVWCLVVFQLVPLQRNN